MSRQARSDDDRPKDARLGRMVLLSGLVHVGVLGVLYTHGESRHSEPLPPQTYTVSLIAPAAVEPAPAPSQPQLAPPPTEVLPPEPEPPELEPPKKEDPPKPTAEKPEPEKPKVQVTEEKPQPLAVQPEPLEKDEKIVVEKKPEPAVEEPAAEPPAPKAAEKPAPEKEKAEVPEKPPVEEGPTDEQRDRQILAALEKVRGRVKPATPAAGTALRGLPFLLYTRQVKQQVRKSWIVAQQKPGTSAVVRFGILPSGDIVAIELARGSGDRVFDESVIRAVKKANPLPPPPEAYRHEFTRQKIEVVFGETRATP